MKLSATVHHNSMGHKTVVTTDRYGNERVYKFRPAGDGVGVEPDPNDNGREYTAVVLQALWDDGVPVDWDPDDLPADERAQLKGFCDECGNALRQLPIGPDEYRTWCAECGHDSPFVGTTPEP